MARFGIYNHADPENTSSMFVYREVPVASAKLNLWNGNIAAGFELLRRAVSLAVSQSRDAVLIESDGGALLAVPSDPPGMTVTLKPGWAVAGAALAGLDEAAALPPGGVFETPATHPRIDSIILRNTGEPDTLTGAEAETPEPPAPPDGAVRLADVFLRPGMAQIVAEDNGVDGYIIDARPMLLTGNAHRHSDDRHPAEPPDGARAHFTTAVPFRPGTLDVYLNGVLQEEGTDYAADADGGGYTFSIPPPAHYRIQHRYLVLHE